MACKSCQKKASAYGRKYAVTQKTAPCLYTREELESKLQHSINIGDSRQVFYLNRALNYYNNDCNRYNGRIR